VGYGLEPILSQEAMDGVVLSGQASLEASNFLGAFELMVEAFSQQMRAVSLSLPEVVGIKADVEEDLLRDY